MASSSCRSLVAALATLCVVACAETPQPTDVRLTRPGAALGMETQAPARQVVVFHGEQGVPADFGQRVALLGGTLEASLDSIGVAIVARSFI